MRTLTHLSASFVRLSPFFPSPFRVTHERGRGAPNFLLFSPPSPLSGLDLKLEPTQIREGNKRKRKERKKATLREIANTQPGRLSGEICSCTSQMPKLWSNWFHLTKEEKKRKRRNKCRERRKILFLLLFLPCGNSRHLRVKKEGRGEKGGHLQK